MSDTRPDTGAHRPGRGLLVLAVVFVVVVIGVGVIQLVSQLARGSAAHDSTLVPQAERLTVNTSAGNVMLSPSTDGVVHVHTETRYGLTPPDLTEESTPAGVLLEARCNGLFAASCEVSYTIAVPPSFTVDVTSRSGNVSARDLTGTVDLDLSSGDIDLAGLSGPLTTATSSGNVTGIGLRSAVIQGETRSGDVDVTVVAPPRQIDLRSSSGDVEIAVPGDRPYRVQTTTSSGTERVSVPTDGTADATVRAETSSGNVTVRPAP
ncbi:DUF4097 family beta strand repeat-containing protein [Pseudonocardia sp. H11422]|uniref:DUF4097 family beta strand repeat-containing protein n=1 Tax=Pseudonocardia sp. H11422 TaxID=2835866 RepID=UPI001BDCD13D|nr:DUF4097 family beta strand repeat-containing protein [Pseudonocardia sp. H11422]